MTAPAGEIRAAAVAALEAAVLTVGGKAVKVDSGRIRPLKRDDYPILLVHVRQGEEEREDKDGDWPSVTELGVTAAVTIGAGRDADALAETQIEALLQQVRAILLTDAALLALVRDIARLRWTLDDPDFVTQDGRGESGRPVREMEIVFEVEHSTPAPAG